MSATLKPKARKSEPFTVEEVSGEGFADLTEAQRAALPALASDLASVLRAMIARGDLSVESGRVVIKDTHPE